MERLNFLRSKSVVNGSPGPVPSKAVLTIFSDPESPVMVSLGKNPAMAACRLKSDAPNAC